MSTGGLGLARLQRAISGCWIGLGLCATPLVAQRPFAETTAIQLPEEQRLRGVLHADLNGDQRGDLALLAIVKGDSFQRRLHIHLRRAEGVPFHNTPDAHILVPEDVVAWASGDVHVDAGEEIILFTATGAYAVRWRADESERFPQLFACDFLWQLPQPRRLHDWQRGMVDLDRDGDLDIVVPEPQGYRLAYQERNSDSARFEVGARLELPLEARVIKRQSRVRHMRRGGSLRFDFDATGIAEAPLLDLRASLPTPSFVDVDGDSDLDAVAQTEKHVHVWVQPERGWQRAGDPAAGVEIVAIGPDQRFDLPVPMDDDRRTDWFYSTRMRDIDRDGRADAIVIAGDLRSEDFRSLAQVFVNGRGNGPAAKSAASPLFGDRGYPDQVLAINGYLVNPRFDDINGDGHDDFALLSLRFDVSKMMNSNGSLDIELFAFLGKGGAFSREPDLTHQLRIKGETMRGGGGELQLRFCGDLTGDGVRELLVRDRAEHLALYWTRAQRGRLEVIPKELWEIHIDEDAEVLLLDRPGVRQELAILEDAQLLHVRFP